MPDRAFIIHGYLSFPEEAWLPWLKTELEKRGYLVSLPAMPRPSEPSIPEWIAFIANLVGEPDENTVMIGHSMGCQAVIRYLETLGALGKSVRKTVLVAGAFPVGMPVDEAKKRFGAEHPLLPWFTTGVDAKKVRAAAGKCTVILSDNDSLIPLERARGSFRGNLDAKFIIEPGKGHFNEDDGLTELPSALQAVIS
jgi:predicted alpha/beta hydrolase family esterase